MTVDENRLSGMTVHRRKRNRETVNELCAYTRACARRHSVNSISFHTGIAYLFPRRSTPPSPLLSSLSSLGQIGRRNIDFLCRFPRRFDVRLIGACSSTRATSVDLDFADIQRTAARFDRTLVGFDRRIVYLSFTSPEAKRTRGIYSRRMRILEDPACELFS